MHMKQLLERFRRYLHEAPAPCALPKGANRGDIAEGIVSAAIAAKLSKRIDGDIGEITPEEVVTYVSKLKQPKEIITNTVPDLGGRTMDTVSFSVSLPAKSFNVLLDLSLIHI